MIKSFGGYLYITFDSNEHPIINYYKDVPNTCTQLIQFGKNLVSYENSLIYDEMYTACIPLGVKDEDGIRLDISSVNDGNVYLINQTLANQYGVRYAPTNLTTWEDVTVASNLKVKGQDWLDNEGIKYKDSISLDAIDISKIRQGVQSFRFLWKAGFKLNNGQTIYYVITKLDIDLNRSANVGVNLGEVKQMYTGLVSQQVNNISDRLDIVQSDYTTRQETEKVAGQVAETVIETTTQLQTQASAIVAEVLQSYYTKQQVDEKFVSDVMSLKSQVEQLASSITASFTYYRNVINELNSSVVEIKSWVTVVPETPTQSVGIIIGNSANAIKLKLENDILYFYVGDDTAPVVLMWLDHETLHIDKVEIQQLSLGIAGKMLDFKIVGSGLNTCAFFSGRLVV